MDIENMDEFFTQSSEETGGQTTGEQAHSSNSRYEIVSRIAYLIGVNKEKFESNHSQPLPDIFDRLALDKRARIIRDLCTIRTKVMVNYFKIYTAMRDDPSRTIGGMSDYLPAECMERLMESGVDLYKEKKDLNRFQYMVNAYIRDRINNCRSLFPEWIKWEYINSLFVMPGGDNEEGLKLEAAKFHENRSLYPYSMYIYWPVAENGNILYDDRKFVTLMYSWHGDELENLSYVCSVSDATQNAIYRFIQDSGSAVFVVDCENSDPYALCAALNALDEENLEKIQKIILYDDVNAASAWEMLQDYIAIPVEYVLIQRIKGEKSLTDVKVATRISKEFFTGNADSFILVSSDSDYWGVIEEIPEARFLVMVEKAKFSNALRNKLIENDIIYCFIDHFYIGDGNDIKTDALKRELSKSIGEAFSLNLKDIMEDSLRRTRITMNEEERRKFLKNHARTKLSVEVDENDNVKLVYTDLPNRKMWIGRQ